MVDLAAYAVQHPSQVYVVPTTALALFALSPTPPFIPLVLLVAALQLQAYIFLPRRGAAVSHAFLQLLLLTVAASVAHIGPSLHALSTPVVSVAALSCFSLLSSWVAFTTFIVSFFATRLARTPWAQVTLFPAVWASVWGAVAYLSPVGRLITWSPVAGLGPYDWIRPILGQYGIDWIVAAWAVVCAHGIGTWLMGSTEGDAVPSEYGDIISLSSEEHRVQPAPRTQKRSTSKTTCVSILTGLLILLTVPSFTSSTFPLSSLSPDTTPLGVACALPSPQRSGQRTRLPSLDDYILETQKLQAYADVILWPEGAVKFNTPEERTVTFEHIKSRVGVSKKYIGVSFEEFVPANAPENKRKAGDWRNGLVVLGPDGPVLEYYKRMLVPVAESFSMAPASDPPEIYTVGLPHPKGWNKTDWAPGPNHTRPIPLTASICLDFSSSSSFDGLSSRPALILAPARTWHIGVAYAMWEQARARAEETGSMVLWCDGGEGGVSGVVGGGMHEFVQVGQGSWSKTIGVQWPFDERRTLFLRGGDGAALVTVWAILGVGWAVEIAVTKLIRGDGGGEQGPSIAARIANVGNLITTFRLTRKRGEERPLLD